MKSSRACLSVLVFLACLGQVKGNDWTEWEGHLYQIVVDDLVSWNDSEIAAEDQLGGYLATITSPEEQQFIEELLQGSASPSGGYWIGLKEAQPDVYVWSNGEPLSYTNWHDGEPNHGVYGGERAHIIWTSDADNSREYFSRRGGWNDIQEAGLAPGSTPWYDIERAGYIVEVVPEPSTIILLLTGALGLLAYRIRRK